MAEPRHRGPPDPRVFRRRGILGFASGAAIGAAFTDTASDCEFEECVDAGILPGAAIGFIVGALVGGIGMAIVWLRRIRKQP